jgi:choline dehydrogenase-like flavoprotein
LLLQQSGITKNVGTRISFNAGSWVFAEFPESVNSFDGIQMCAYHEASRFFTETLAMPPGAFAVAMPGWFESHFDRMRRYRHFAVAGALIPTSPVGTVKRSRLPLIGDLLPPLKFALPVTDLRRLRDGVEAVGRIWFAAGASRVIPATFQPLEFSDADQLYELESLIVEPDDLAFGSAHPQGGNPMSDDPALGAVSSDFRVHGLDNVYVVDASVFPTALGVNPQLTIMAMAHRAAARIASL